MPGYSEDALKVKAIALNDWGNCKITTLKRQLPSSDTLTIWYPLILKRETIYQFENCKSRNNIVFHACTTTFIGVVIH